MTSKDVGGDVVRKDGGARTVSVELGMVEKSGTSDVRDSALHSLVDVDDVG